MARSIELRRFAPHELILTQEQACRVLRYYFPQDPIDVRAVTDADRGFAQALLIEGVDRSKEMGYVQVLFDKALMKPPVDFSFIKDVAKALGRHAVRNWFRRATGADLQNPAIYEVVRAQISRSFRSVWSLRLQTGELTY